MPNHLPTTRGHFKAAKVLEQETTFERERKWVKGQIILTLKVYWYAKKKNVEKCGEAMMTLVLNEFLEFLVSLTKNAQRSGPQPLLDPKILETASSLFRCLSHSCFASLYLSMEGTGRFLVRINFTFDFWGLIFLSCDFWLDAFDTWLRNVVSGNVGSDYFHFVGTSPDQVLSHPICSSLDW